jgi:hypothetical protein
MGVERVNWVQDEAHYSFLSSVKAMCGAVLLFSLNNPVTWSLGTRAI